MSDIKELKKENEKLKSDLQSANIVSDLLQRENKHLREEIESLQSEIDIMDGTKQKTDEILHELSEAQATILSLQDQIEDYKKNYIEKTLYEELQEKVKVLTEERDMANESLKQVDALYQKIGELVNENEELKEKNQKKKINN